MSHGSGPVNTLCGLPRLLNKKVVCNQAQAAFLNSGVLVCLSSGVFCTSLNDCFLKELIKEFSKALKNVFTLDARPRLKAGAQIYLCGASAFLELGWH